MNDEHPVLAGVRSWLDDHIICDHPATVFHDHGQQLVLTLEGQCSYLLTEPPSTPN